MFSRIGLLLCLSLRLTAADLRAAAEIVDITPPAGTRMWGYTGRDQGGTGAADKLGARILYLEGENDAVAWVDLDLGRTFGRDAMDWVREQVQVSIPHVVFSATHTHSGPEVLESYGEARPEWEQRALQAIVAALLKARNNAQSVRLGFAYGRSEIGYNRRLVEGGRVTMLFDSRRDGRRASGPTDPTVAVLRLDRRDGTPLAVIVNATAHPVLLGRGNLRFSPDYPGPLRRAVERAWNPGPVCFFLQGATGVINPLWPSEATTEDEAVSQLGERLASEVLRVANTIQSRPAATGRVEVRQESVLLRSRWGPLDFAGEYRLLAPYVGHIASLLQVPVTAIVVDNAVALVTFPGEMFVEHQLDLRKRSPIRDTMVAGYADGYYGYFPTIEAAAAGGYGANDVMAATELGGGESLVNRALILLNSALGRFRREPPPAR